MKIKIILHLVRGLTIIKASIMLIKGGKKSQKSTDSVSKMQIQKDYKLPYGLSRSHRTLCREQKKT